MKKIVLLACLIFFAIAINAQTPYALPNFKPKPTFGFKGKPTLPFLLPSPQKPPYELLAQGGSTKTVYNIDNMPVAGMDEVALTYKGNNGNGLSVYSATPDNMPIVKPDSTVYFTMPVAANQHWQPAQSR